jgi:glycosyltransferase involved in cell wall biosynthesis
VKKTITEVGNEVVPIPPSGWGAVEKWIIEVMSRLNKKYNFKIISLPAKERVDIQNTEFIYLSKMCSFFKRLGQFETNYIKRYLGVSPSRYLVNRKHLTSWSFTHYLRKEIERHETDIYHFHQRPEYIFYTKPGKPVILHLHNRIDELTKSFPLFPEFFKGIDLADVLITVSKDMMKYYREKGVEKKKMRLIYNGVDTERYRYVKKSKRLKILFVGNLVERKGVLYLIRAFNEIKSQLPGAELFIVGRKNEKSDYVKELRRNSTEGVTFTGTVTEEELIRHYQSANILVHPALYEAFGMTLVEAMSCGTPVIATKVGGIPEVLGDAGILIKPKNVEEIVKSVLKLADNRKLYDNLAKRSRERVEHHFSWESVSQNLAKVYEEF